jgi:hypothetical protein
MTDKAWCQLDTWHHNAYVNLHEILGMTGFDTCTGEASNLGLQEAG